MWESDVALNISWISTTHSTVPNNEYGGGWETKCMAMTSRSPYCDRDGTAQMDRSMNDKLWALYERGGGSRSMTS